MYPRGSHWIQGRAIGALTRLIVTYYLLGGAPFTLQTGLGWEFVDAASEPASPGGPFFLGESFWGV